MLQLSKANSAQKSASRFCSQPILEAPPLETRPILRGGHKEMKTVYALLLSILLMAAGAFAQQQPTSTQQDSKSVDAPKAVKKSASKKKARKEQKEQKEVAGEVEHDAMPPALSEHLRKLAETRIGNG